MLDSSTTPAVHPSEPAKDSVNEAAHGSVRPAIKTIAPPSPAPRHVRDPRKRGDGLAAASKPAAPFGTATPTATARPTICCRSMSMPRRCGRRSRRCVSPNGRALAKQSGRAAAEGLISSTIVQRKRRRWRDQYCPCAPGPNQYEARPHVRMLTIPVKAMPLVTSADDDPVLGLRLESGNRRDPPRPPQKVDAPHQLDGFGRPRKSDAALLGPQQASAGQRQG